MQLSRWGHQRRASSHAVGIQFRRECRTCWLAGQLHHSTRVKGINSSLKWSHKYPIVTTVYPTSFLRVCCSSWKVNSRLNLQHRSKGTFTQGAMEIQIVIYLGNYDVLPVDAVVFGHPLSKSALSLRTWSDVFDRNPSWTQYRMHPEPNARIRGATLLLHFSHPSRWWNWNRIWYHAAVPTVTGRQLRKSQLSTLCSWRYAAPPPGKECSRPHALCST